MRLHRTIPLLAIALFFFAEIKAAEETAVVTEGKINVRGQPSLIGEVITQLQRGEKVTVLERTTVENPKSGEPTNWAKIKLPQNTPVWVFAPFVKDGKVAVSRLNVRAGRGENYSVIGRLVKDDAVKPIQTVEEWMEIEPPTNSYAFVDLDLLQFEGGTNTLANTAPNTPPAQAEPPAIAPATNRTETIAAAVPSTPSELQPATVIPQPAPQPETPRVKPEIPAPTPERVGPTAVKPNNTAATTPSAPSNLPKVAEPLRKRTEPPPKRVVRREGIIRATTSIQAPTWYELVHADTKKRINYLFDENMGVNLKDYRGQKVVVSGEEAIDPRWPNTPILDLQTLDVLP